MSKHKNKKPAFDVNRDDLEDIDIDPEVIAKTERLKDISQAVWKPKNQKAKNIDIISRLVRRQKNGFNL